MSNRTVSVTLQAKVAQYVGGMKAATAQTDQFVARHKAAAKSQSESWKKIGLVAGVGAVAVAYGAKKSIDAASDLAETMQKSQVVFGKSQSTIDKFAQGSAKSMGMSKQAAVEAAATYGNLFTAFGVGQDAAASMSTELVGLASDLASFNNTSIDDALAAITSGLSGEMEPLRRYGIVLSDVRLRQEAFAQGLISSTKDAMSPAVKAQAAYALAMKDSKNAQGDFLRTQDSLANRQRTLAAQFEDTQAAVGEGLMPAMEAATGAASSLMSLFGKLPEPVQSATVAVTAFGLAALYLGPKLSAAKTALNGMVASKGWSGIAGMAGKAGLIGGLTLLAGAALSAHDDASQLVDTLDELSEALRTGDAEAYADAVQRIGQQIQETQSYVDDMASVDGMGDLFSNIGDYFSVGIQNITGQISDVDRAKESLAAAKDEAAHFAAVAGDVKNALGLTGDQAAELMARAKEGGVDLAGNYHDVAQRVVEWGQANSGAAGLVKQHAAAAQELLNVTASVEDQVKALDDLMSGSANKDQAAQSWDDLKQSIEDNGKALGRWSQAGRDNRNAIRQFVLDQAQAEGGAQNLEQTMTRVGRAFGMNKTQAMQLANRLGITKDLLASIDAQKAEAEVDIDATQAGQELARVKSKLGALKDKRIQLKAEGAAKQDIAKVDQQIRRLKDKKIKLQADGARQAKAQAEAAGDAADDASKGKHDIDFNTNAPQAKSEVDDFNTSLANTPRSIDTYINVHKVERNAAGGWAGSGVVRGPGTSTSDSIPARLSNGEFVVNAAAANRNARLLEFINAGGTIPGFRNGGKASEKAQKKYDKALARWQSWKDNLTSVRDNRQSHVRGVASSFMSSASVMGFDFGAHLNAVSDLQSAQDELASSTDDLAEAKRRVATASRAERPEALKRLAEVNERMAKAKQAVADAQQREADTRPTSANILKSFGSRLGTMLNFVGHLRQLKAMGVHPMIISDIIASGLETGSQMAAALVSANPMELSQFTAMQAQIVALGTDVGMFSAGVSWNDDGISYDEAVANAHKGKPKKPKKPGKAKGGGGGGNKNKKAKKRAGGGFVTAGDPYLVGEDGAELFVPTSSGSIVSSSHMTPLMRGGDGAAAPAGKIQIQLPGVGTLWEGFVQYHRRTGYSVKGGGNFR